MKKYLELKDGQKENVLEIELYYNIGRMNYFTGRPERRGYYLMVVPIQKSGYCTITGAFTGIKKLLLPVVRKSNKAEAAAELLAAEAEAELIQYVLRKNNLELKGAEENVKP